VPLTLAEVISAPLLIILPLLAGVRFSEYGAERVFLELETRKLYLKENVGKKSFRAKRVIPIKRERYRRMRIP